MFSSVENDKDRFAVAGQVMLHGRIGRVKVGDVPKEMSRYVWNAMLHGAKFTAHVTDQGRSPLPQEALEIVKLWWADECKYEIMKEQIMKCSYPNVMMSMSMIQNPFSKK